MSKQIEMKIKIIVDAMTAAGLSHWQNWTAKEISTWIKNHFSTNRYLSNKASLIIYSKINENE